MNAVCDKHSLHFKHQSCKKIFVRNSMYLNKQSKYRQNIHQSATETILSAVLESNAQYMYNYGRNNTTILLQLVYYYRLVNISNRHRGLGCETDQRNKNKMAAIH